MRAAHPTVLLFDIDGTLVSTGGAGRRSMAGAFTAIHGDRGPTALDFSFAGMTDRAIVRTGLRVLATSESEPDETAIDRVLDVYLTHLSVEILRSENYQVHPGVTSILTSLASVENVAVGLGTGNVKKGAYTKLARGCLH